MLIQKTFNNQLRLTVIVTLLITVALLVYTPHTVAAAQFMPNCNLGLLENPSWVTNLRASHPTQMALIEAEATDLVFFRLTNTPADQIYMAWLDDPEKDFIFAYVSGQPVLSIKNNGANPNRSFMALRQDTLQFINLQNVSTATSTSNSGYQQMGILQCVQAGRNLNYFESPETIAPLLSSQYWVHDKNQLPLPYSTVNLVGFTHEPDPNAPTSGGGGPTYVDEFGDTEIKVISVILAITITGLIASAFRFRT